MGNPTLREGMESADGWVEYLHGLLKVHFFGTDFEFTRTDGKFDHQTKLAVERYQRDIGLTGEDVDGVVGDQTWSALQGHATLDPRGSDGFPAGTYVDHGRHLRFDPTDMGYMNGLANEADKLYMRVIIVGDVDVPKESVVPTVHVEGPNGTTNPNQFSYYPGSTGPGGWFQIIVDEATNYGPAGRYRVIAQLPMDTGGDTLVMEFDREVRATQ
jgi:Putative peptidoglycan binding domain